MTAGLHFPGFPKEILDFYMNLTINNDKLWFEENRADYERYVLEPARQFVEVMGARLMAIAPDVHADPRINKSLFKIFRDTRFSHDKTPFKTHMAIWFWEGEGARMECSGFYFHLEPTMFMLGAGIYRFPKNLLDKYRRTVVDKKQGQALIKAIGQVEREEGFQVEGRHFKKTPRGFDSAHPNAEYLLYNGLYAGREMEITDIIHQPELVDFCFENFQKTLPIHHWLLNMTRSPVG